MAPSFAARAEPATPARTVVIVDDDPTLVDALSDVLIEEGWDVDAYTDPELALDRLVNGPAPSLVLLDYVMPRIDGDAFVEALSAQRSDVRVVMLSAMAETPKSSDNPCVVGVIKKPFELDFLLSTVDRLGRM